EVIHDAINAINILKSKDCKVMFITNNSSKLAEEYVMKLKEIGVLNVTDNEVMTSGDIAVSYLKKELEKEPQKNKVLCVCGNAVKTLLKRAGFKIVDPREYKKANYVVVGITTDFDWELGNYASNAIAVYGAKFIATNPDIAKPVPNGEIFAGTGAIVKFIETASQTEPLIMGKPYSTMFEIAIQKMGLNKSQVLMVGDLLNTDIKGALDFGIDSALVLTGLHQRKDIQRLGIMPTYVIESLMELVS
ncbi:MAG: HAD-IIA family hydrolase, partial [Candidatus Poribacteria bacterium]